MSPKTSRKPRPQLWKALRKCSHGHLNEIFSSFEQEMASTRNFGIRLARKADGRVQHLSSGNLPLAALK